MDLSKRSKVVLLILIILGISFAGYSIAYVLSEEPVFELPLEDAVDDTEGIQTFHEEHDGTVHAGFDFQLEKDTKIIAPVDGVISGIIKHQMSNGLWIIDVNIDINLRWYTFIAFEPCTEDEDVIDEQMEEITVKVGDRVKVGDKLGTLTPVKDSEFPHIHWNVVEKWIIGVGPGTDRSPYHLCSEDAQDDLDDLCDEYDKPPSYD